MSRLATVALCVLVTSLWGSAFTFIPMALESFEPLDLMVLRFSLAAVCYAALLWSGVIRAKAIGRSDWPRFVAMTAILVVGYNVLLCSAQVHVPANLAILVGQAAPVLVLLLERLMYGAFQVPHPRIALGTWLSGTVLVFLNFCGELSGGGWPLVMLCLTPVAMASYMVLSRPLVRLYGGANVCAQMFLTGGAFLFLTRGWCWEFWVQVRSASTGSLLAILGLVLLTTVVSYTLWFTLLRVHGASAIASYLNLVPVSGFALTALVLCERPSLQIVLAGALVVLGSASSSGTLGRTKDAQISPR